MPASREDVVFLKAIHWTSVFGFVGQLFMIPYMRNQARTGLGVRAVRAIVIGAYGSATLANMEARMARMSAVYVMAILQSADIGRHIRCEAVQNPQEEADLMV